MDVREFELAMLERFPLCWAEPWDNVGLAVGDPDAAVTGVAVALDATPRNIRRAAAEGCNVLLTHHPVWIDPPRRLAPRAADAGYAGSALYEAVRSGVSIVSLHTNLDRSPEARAALPALVGMAPESSLEHAQDPDLPGLGAWCALDEPLSLRDVAEKAGAAFGCVPRVWGEAASPVRKAAFLGGSLGDFGVEAARLGADVVVAGEAGYHVCQDVLERGVSLVLLGHDRSEEPLTRVLADAAAQVAPDSTVRVLPTEYQWWSANEGAFE